MVLTEIFCLFTWPGGPPDPPTNLVTSDATHNSFRATWAAPEEPVERFRVEYMSATGQPQQVPIKILWKHIARFRHFKFPLCFDHSVDSHWPTVVWWPLWWYLDFNLRVHIHVSSQKCLCIGEGTMLPDSVSVQLLSNFTLKIQRFHLRGSQSKFWCHKQLLCWPTGSRGVRDLWLS